MLFLISKSLITTHTQSLRFDTLSIALSYKDSSYCEWLILLLIYFGKQKTTSVVVQEEKRKAPKVRALALFLSFECLVVFLGVEYSI
jgi:hypothetical protein